MKSSFEGLQKGASLAPELVDLTKTMALTFSRLRTPGLSAQETTSSR